MMAIVSAHSAEKTSDMEKTNEQIIEDLRAENEKLQTRITELSQSLKSSIPFDDIKSGPISFFKSQESACWIISDAGKSGSQDRLGSGVSSVTWGRAANILSLFVSQYEEGKK